MTELHALKLELAALNDVAARLRKKCDVTSKAFVVERVAHIGHKYALQALVKAAESLLSGGYTEKSRKALDKAIKKAKKVSS